MESETLMKPKHHTSRLARAYQRLRDTLSDSVIVVTADEGIRRRTQSLFAKWTEKFDGEYLP